MADDGNKSCVSGCAGVLSVFRKPLKRHVSCLLAVACYITVHEISAST